MATDSLVNIAVGDSDILRNARVAVAAQVIAQICNVNVGPIVVLGRAVDRATLTDSVCTVRDIPVTISQN